MANTAIDLSVILPVYNESQILEESVKAVDNILKQSNYRYEIIIAEDASTDGTDKIAKELSEKNSNIIWCHRDKRVGRGSAVANAIRKSRGRIVGFLDADLEAAPHYILPLAMKIDQGDDISTGVRHIYLKRMDFLFKLDKILTHY